MRKLNIFFTMLLLVALNNLAFGQQNRSVYIIGSTFSVGSGTNVCYPATPAPIRSTQPNNTSTASDNTSNSHLYSTSPIADLDVVIANAYARGFRHFYFQEGIYVISTPINLNNLNGITIEGGGAGTVFKPSSTTLTTIFDVKNCYNGKIKNLGIDLKTTLVCGTGGQDTNDINTGIKIGTQVGRCLFENIFFRSNIANNATVKGTSPILVQLTAGQESDWNTFNNIQFQRSRGGIVLDITGSDNPDDLASNGVFNHNTFSNIHLEHCLVGVDFIGSGGTIEGNLFSNFDVQASKDTDGGLRLRTTDIVRNIRGINNTFQNFNIGDFNACPSATSPGCSAIGYVFSVTDEAERTVIENTETEGNFVTGSDAKNGWYIDGGIGTQFINNASTNRLTDYIKRNLSDVIFVGQNSPNPVANTGTAYNFDATVANSANKNYFRVDNFGSVTFNGRTENLKKVDSIISQETYLKSSFNVENFGELKFGRRNNATGNGFYGATAAAVLETTNLMSNTEIYGNVSFSTHGNMFLKEIYTTDGSEQRQRPFESIDTNAKKYVITNANGWGKFQWTKIGDLTWDHIATKNIKMNGFALTNHSNATPVTNADAGLRLDNNGNVRIGTAAPNANNFAKLQVDGRVFIGDASATNTDFLTGVNALAPEYKLIVNGKVRVRNEVYVKQGGLTWPDYVFANDYKLMPLQEVEQHINEKGYLPNMPSAAEVEKDGIAVGDLIKRQQEKIEELTLYLIEMKKQNDEIQKELKVIKANQKN